MGGLSCGMTCMKYLLFTFNLVFWIAGISVFAVGLWSRIAAKDYEVLLSDTDVDEAANMLIAAGIFILAIGVLGCCGAMKENKCCLLLYALFVFVIFVMQIAAGIIAYINRDQLKEEMSRVINTTVFQQYGDPNKSKFTKAIDFAQENIECCGANNYSDWKHSYWVNHMASRNQLIPLSCCKENRENCTIAPLKLENIYMEGCIKGMEDWTKEHLVVVGGVGLGIAIIQILGMVFAICLYKAIGYEKI